MTILVTALHWTLLSCPLSVNAQPPVIFICGTQVNSFVRHSEVILLSGGLCHMNFRSHVIQLNFHESYKYFRFVNLKALKPGPVFGSSSSRKIRYVRLTRHQLLFQYIFNQQLIWAKKNWSRYLNFTLINRKKRKKGAAAKIWFLEIWLSRPRVLSVWEYWAFLGSFEAPFFQKWNNMVTGKWALVD